MLSKREKNGDMENNCNCFVNLDSENHKAAMSFISSIYPYKYVYI